MPQRNEKCYAICGSYKQISRDELFKVKMSIWNKLGKMKAIQKYQRVVVTVS